MILDSSAVIAILIEEPQVDQLLPKFEQSVDVGIGAPTLLETAVVLASRIGARSKDLLEKFVDEAEVAILPFGEMHWQLAFDAYQRFGKGRHPASLNFGDCMAYATAKVARKPLLCLGNDFVQTDLDLA